MNCVIWEGTCVTEATGTAVRSDKVDYFLETCFENFVRRREWLLFSNYIPVSPG